MEDVKNEETKTEAVPSGAGLSEEVKDALTDQKDEVFHEFDAQVSSLISRFVILARLKGFDLAVLTSAIADGLALHLGVAEAMTLHKAGPVGTEEIERLIIESRNHNLSEGRKMFAESRKDHVPELCAGCGKVH